MLVAGLPASPGGAQAEPDDLILPSVPRPCSTVDDPPFDVQRPAFPHCQRILYYYGPLEVTPGDNLNLLGPVVLERPQVDGYVVRFEPNLILADGTVPPVDILHLHHSVWYSTAHPHPLFAAGEEKTIINLPSGYGIPVHATATDTHWMGAGTDPNQWGTEDLPEMWLLNFMLHNQTPRPERVFITYEIDFIPQASIDEGAVDPITAVEPFWMDVTRDTQSIYQPIYNTQRGFGAVEGECSYPKERCAAFDPYGETDVLGQGAPGNGVGYTAGINGRFDGTMIWVGGHLHPGGKRLDMQVRRKINGAWQYRDAFTSDALYWDDSCLDEPRPDGAAPDQRCPLSWDMALEVSNPGWRLRLKAGDQIVLNSVYENEHASWYEGMGIMVGFIAPGDASGRDLFTGGTLDPHGGSLTHGPLPEASHHGGEGRTDVVNGGAGIDTEDVGIAGFTYTPGNQGSWTVAIPEVERGEELTFTNLDTPGAIWHSVTACKAGCDGGTGVSYPVANGPVDFDSSELGYGNPHSEFPVELLPEPYRSQWAWGFKRFNASSDRLSYGLDTSSFTAGEYTFYCRVHPFMRGAFRVVE